MTIRRRRTSARDWEELIRAVLKALEMSRPERRELLAHRRQGIRHWRLLSSRDRWFTLRLVLGWASAWAKAPAAGVRAERKFLARSLLALGSLGWAHFSFDETDEAVELVITEDGRAAIELLASGEEMDGGF